MGSASTEAEGFPTSTNHLRTAQVSRAFVSKARKNAPVTQGHTQAPWEKAMRFRVLDMFKHFSTFELLCNRCALNSSKQL